VTERKAFRIFLTAFKTSPPRAIAGTSTHRIPTEYRTSTFYFFSHTQTALACVIHNTASSVPLYMNKLVREVRLLTYFREVSDLNLYLTLTIQTDVFRGLLIPFVRNAETLPGSILR